MKKNAFTHVNSTGGIRCIGMMSMMGVVVIKAAQEYFFFISLIISISISKQHEIGTLRHIYSLRGNLKSNRQVKTVGKRYLFVCFTICISVFKNNDLVIRFVISGFVM